MIVLYRKNKQKFSTYICHILGYRITYSALFSTSMQTKRTIPTDEVVNLDIFILGLRRWMKNCQARTKQTFLCWAHYCTTYCYHNKDGLGNTVACTYEFTVKKNENI